MSRLIFHIDVNSAFLSWESARRVKEGLPDLRDIPACIGGDPKKRTGIVVANSGKEIWNSDGRADGNGPPQVSGACDRAERF